jgi:transposase
MRPRKPFPSGSAERLGPLVRQAKSIDEFKRLQCVWLRAALDLSVEEISLAVGLSPSSVRCYHSRYLKRGEIALLGRPRGGRRHQNLTVNQEQRFLGTFIATAERGGILEVSQVKAGYEKAVGRKVPKSTIYRLLARHGWRKLAPRPHHPKSDPARREEFKKNSARSSPPK